MELDDAQVRRTHVLVRPVSELMTLIDGNPLTVGTLQPNPGSRYFRLIPNPGEGITER